MLKKKEDRVGSPRMGLPAIRTEPVSVSSLVHSPTLKASPSHEKISQSPIHFNLNNNNSINNNNSNSSNSGSSTSSTSSNSNNNNNNNSNNSSGVFSFSSFTSVLPSAKKEKAKANANTNATTNSGGLAIPALGWTNSWNSSSSSSSSSSSPFSSSSSTPSTQRNPLYQPRMFADVVVTDSHPRRSDLNFVNVSW